MTTDKQIEKDVDLFYSYLSELSNSKAVIGKDRATIAAQLAAAAMQRSELQDIAAALDGIERLGIPDRKG